jgi:hypothetical protein
VIWEKVVPPSCIISFPKRFRGKLVTIADEEVDKQEFEIYLWSRIQKRSYMELRNEIKKIWEKIMELSERINAIEPKANEPKANLIGRW